ncbi:hypothetical protein [Methylovorus mays]|uniref:hypothetical protein n=1 Tax=Methylovorus mays TaxID=184077 RepID=UPI001E2D9595|nr:hypothetical protein [Methylovorus mays]MCB5205766.1 hypothetical protein [Methylovorus mays]
MNRETVNRIEVLDTGEFFLGIEGKGKSMYQYIYREAAGVYWDPALQGFKSTPMREWSCTQWYKQIVSVARSGLGVDLLLADHIDWKNVPEIDKAEIQRAKASKNAFRSFAATAAPHVKR